MSALLLSVYVGMRVFPIYIHILTCICLAYLSNILLVMSTGLWDEHFCIAKCLTNTPKNLQKKEPASLLSFALFYVTVLFIIFLFSLHLFLCFFVNLLLLVLACHKHTGRKTNTYGKIAGDSEEPLHVCVCGFLLFFYLF